MTREPDVRVRAAPGRDSIVMRATCSIALVLFAVVFYLMGADIVRPWLPLPSFGSIGFTLFFTCFSLSHAAASLGWKRAAAFFGITTVVSWGFEELGVATGLIYGPYHYSNMLGPKLGFVPVLIPLAWFMMIYPSWCVARILLPQGGEQRRSLRVALATAGVAAMVVTAWDTVMDPVMSRQGNWIWEKSGDYFGVPLQNYGGWLLTTFTIYLLAGAVMGRMPRATSRTAWNRLAVLPVLLYGWYAVKYMMPQPIAPLRLVAFFAMGFPGLLALGRLLLASRPILNISGQRFVSKRPKIPTGQAS